MKHACQLPLSQPRHICLETLGHDGGAQGVDGASPKARPKGHLEEVVATTVYSRQEGGHQERVGETTRSRLHKKYLPSRVASQPCT